ncbi:hypothetical protein [Saccharothrix obliqua]|uniref:hypothetical protein n=1 Tax=Saccharothrix obliqua TaxID=2861747 RepID=UPI001C5DE467|nr:hypothetical protein [Saccharothrix obliqua]MBW4718111.1 hypothetical protein [Saccharothrix obliqua]
MRPVLLLPALLLATSVTPAAAEPVTAPPPGWTVTGTRLTWTAAEPVPPGGAAVEFWDGDRRLGVPRPSPDLRTYTLDRVGIRGVDGLQVRSSGRRLDVVEPPARPLVAPPPVAAPLPVGAVDPGRPGPFRTRGGEYALDPVEVPGYATPIEMRAVVVAPKDAPGRRPLALFLHGRHFTCYDPAQPGRILLEWPCSAGAEAVPSYRGYLQAQELLASQGYVTVSISANGVNAQDALDRDSGAGARSALVRSHLAKWAGWAGSGRASAPEVVRASPVADLSKVFLVGHSRGGEGVNRAAIDSTTPPPPGSGYDGPVRWQIKGDLLIGPTALGQNPAPDVPSATILPGCDGDVSDLQGQVYLDGTRGVSQGTALHSALYFVGANHNYFNTEWTPGQAEAPAFDDFAFADAVCSPGTPHRLTPAQQQTAAATYIAAAARLFVTGDQKVLPLLDGTGVRAPSADPARVLSHALGGARTPLVTPDDNTEATGTARMCDQVTPDAATSCTDPAEWWGSPHFVRFSGTAEEAGRKAVALDWSAGGTAVVRPGGTVSLTKAKDLALRLIVPPNSTGNRFEIAITDAAGRRAPLGTATLDGLPATEQMSARWAQEVRVPLPKHGIDLRHVTALEINTSGGTGQAWLIDAHGRAPGLPNARPTTPPARVDVGLLTVPEGDSGTRTARVPVTVSAGPASVRLFVHDDAGRTFTQRLVTLPSGQHTVEIPMDVTGNTRWSPGSQRVLLAKGVRGAVAGRYLGGLDILDDDPEPTITVTPVADHVTEGNPLSWQVTLSEPVEGDLLWLGVPVAPGGPELSSTDVNADWFQALSGQDPQPSRPLSTTALQPLVFLPAGGVSAPIRVPTVADAEVEPAEHVRFDFAAWPTGGQRITVSGTVTDPRG